MIRTTLVVGLVGFGFGLGAGAASAQDGGGPVVVELFTSQGCSSCPPADALLADLAGQPGVLPLALHVDYWDYIGWEDTFADPAHTARQRAYADAVGNGMVYTPHMVIGGADHMGGVRPMELFNLIEAHRAAGAGVALEVAAQSGELAIEIEVPHAPSPANPMQVALVGFVPREEVTITRGENAGRTLAYHNIVVSWEVVGSWAGEAAFAATVPHPAAEGVAVLVQEAGPGRIVAADLVDAPAD